MILRAVRLDPIGATALLNGIIPVILAVSGAPNADAMVNVKSFILDNPPILEPSIVTVSPRAYPVPGDTSCTTVDATSENSPDPPFLVIINVAPVPLPLEYFCFMFTNDPLIGNADPLTVINEYPLPSVNETSDVADGVVPILNVVSSITLVI